VYRTFVRNVIFDGNYFNEIWIDPHYEIKHGSSINDDLILDLLQDIEKRTYSEKKRANGYDYYELDVDFHEKLYRLILVVPLHMNYLGVRNVYRRSK